SQQVTKIVLVAKQAWPRKQSRVGLLDEVLRVLTRTAQRPGCTVKPIDVVAEPARIEGMFRAAGIGRSRLDSACPLRAHLVPNGPTASSIPWRGNIRAAAESL